MCLMDVCIRPNKQHRAHEKVYDQVLASTRRKLVDESAVRLKDTKTFRRAEGSNCALSQVHMIRQALH
jgi:hypothetical protein